MPQQKTDAGHERRAQPRTADDRWQTALTDIAPNKILIRGYPLDEMMGRLSFAEAVYVLLMGELPTTAIGRMFNAILVSSLDHGVTPPSTLAARHVWRTDEGLRGRGHPRVRAAPWRRHRGVHAVPRHRPCARARWTIAARRSQGARRRLHSRARHAAGFWPSVSHAGSARGAVIS